MTILKRFKIYFFVIKWYLITKYFRKFKNREALLQWQRSRVNKVIEYATAHSRYYANLYRDHQVKLFEELPTIKKSDFMQNFDDLNTVGISRQEAFKLAGAAEHSRDFTKMYGEITVGLSSGTSGNRGIFLVSEEERYAWAGAILAKLLPGSLFENHSIAFFLRASSNLYTSLINARLALFKFAFFEFL